jgi:ketosteroid isomerase-like protein
VLTPAEVADLAELNQLAYRYAAAVDACDVAAFLDVFHPEAKLTVFPPGEGMPSSVVTGHEQLATIPDSMREMFTRTAHLMTNHLIDLDGDRANGSLLCTARHLHADSGVDVVIVIRYLDQYERRQQQWRILDREIRFLWGESHATLDPDQTFP